MLNKPMRIAICDDDSLFCKKIAGLCNRFYGSSITINVFPNGELLLKGTQSNNYYFIFLDIEMDGKNGITVKNILECNNNKSNIIFITAYRDYVMEAFVKNVCGFIEKPVDYRKLSNILCKIDGLELKNQSVTVSDAGEKIPLNYNKKSYIVNCEYITRINSHVIMADGSKLNPRRNKSKALKEAYFNYNITYHNCSISYYYFLLANIIYNKRQKYL